MLKELDWQDIALDLHCQRSIETQKFDNLAIDPFWHIYIAL